MRWDPWHTSTASCAALSPPWTNFWSFVGLDTLACFCDELNRLYACTHVRPLQSARTGEGPSEGCLRGRGVYVLGEFKTGPVMNRNVKAIVELLGGEVLSVAPGAGTDAVVVCDPDNLRTRRAAAGHVA